MSREFATSWITLVVVFIIGLFLLKDSINSKDKNLSLTTVIKGYAGAIGALVYSILVTIGKLLGKI